MNYLFNPLKEISEYKQAIRGLEDYSFPVTLVGPSDSQKAHLAFSVCQDLNCKGIYIAYNELQARKILEDFACFAGDEVLFFPAKEIMMHDVEAKSYDAVHQRLNVLDHILEGSCRWIVTSAEAIAQKLVSPEIFKQFVLRLEVGGKIDLQILPGHLTAMGYERVETVEGKGQFAIRGGIIDVFPPNEENAARIELFDDEVDSIRTFDILTQRSLDRLEKLKVIPSREVLYTPQQQQEIIGKIDKDRISHIGGIKSEKNLEYVNELNSRILQDIERFKSDYYFAGLDRYIPYIVDPASDLTGYIQEAENGNDDFAVFMDEPARFGQRLENILLEHQETCKTQMEKGRILPKSFHAWFDKESIVESLQRRKLIRLNTMPIEDRLKIETRQYSILSRQLNSYQGHMELLVDDLKLWKAKNNRVVVFSGTRGKGERLVETLRSNGLEALYVHSAEEELVPGQILITHGSLHKGFEYPSIGLVVVSDREIFGQDKRLRKASGKKEGKKIKAFTDLSLGDYVVHQAHGIGQYVGIQKLSVEGIKKDYLKILYHGGDYLYIPTSQLDLIQKYIGAEGKLPRMNKMGGAEWTRTKNRVKESLKELAAELVKLYAQRQSVQGHAFSGDTVWQQQFEELFPYQETEDQLKCIEEIKADMEAKKPMDRLLCGDVGYGKTEVALRAVFKAVMDGKQVAYLVPTTVLAQQQYTNFKERLKDFPVSVEMVSRFRTAAEQKKILKEVKTGQLDILVGTHRLLQKDIHFKDLGLLVVDEEQRFGVTHKEKLKNIKPNVDVLTLTATPIPRTLHMSMVGIRDISVLEDPPEERYPVQTYVMEYNEEVIRDAILRELSRKGQIFYLYNRVRTIQLKTGELQRLVPEARIGVAHGQMAENQLENIMTEFLDGAYDMLVCTTIIESGLDMPNVNTIIVEDADRMGLAQLYQLRGRVGRSNRLAYAYVTYKREKVLAEIAEKRLQAIKEFTEFGSGFKIAMRDMELRGAGNILGPEQHGHMDTVGYDMYCRLLDEAVRELQGEGPRMEETEITIDLQVSAYIDESYIPSESQKIEMYKRIASILDEQDAMDVEDELTDRYGDIPSPVKNLISIAFLKGVARECGFASIQQKGGAILFQYKDNSRVSLPVLGGLMDKYRRKLMFTASNTPYLTLKAAGVGSDELLTNIKFLLQDIIKLKNTQ